jgi:hypothetical protein
MAPVATGRHVLVLGNLAAPIEWVLLIFAIVALGFAGVAVVELQPLAVTRHHGLASVRGRLPRYASWCDRARPARCAAAGHWRWGSAVLGEDGKELSILAEGHGTRS